VASSKTLKAVGWLELWVKANDKIYLASKTASWQTELIVVFHFVTICLLSFLQKLYFLLKDAFIWQFVL
jgi:hypothetical protein